MFQRRRVKKERHSAPELIDGFLYRDVATDTVYMFKKGKRYKFISERAAQSWRLPIIRVASVDIVSEDRSKYGGVLGFRDTTLLENIADGRLYVISANRRRHIKNPDWLFEHGILNGEVVQVSEQEVEVHEEGEPLE